jgi:hypothetical protein
MCDDAYMANRLAVLALALACTPASTDDAPSKATASEPAPTPASEPEPDKPEPPIGDPGDAIAITGVGISGCALQRAGTVACWGSNNSGQLGQGHRDEIENPVLIPGLDDAVAISASLGAGCALRRSGVVVCWGDPSRGELGNGKTGEVRGLVEVGGVRHVTGVFSGGASVSCATTQSGRAWCWGSLMVLYPMFNPPSEQQLGPFPLELEGVRAPYLSPVARSVAYLADGSVMARDRKTGWALVPDAVEVYANTKLECIVRSSGEVACTFKNRKREVVIEQLRGARQLSHPLWHGPLVGILPDGTLAAASIDDDPTPAFKGPGDIVALTRDYFGTVTGIGREGQVFAWRSEITDGGDYVARELVLPEPSTVGSAIPSGAPLDPPAPESSLPSWCSVEIQQDLPGDHGTFEQMAKTIGAPPTDSEWPSAWSLEEYEDRHPGMGLDGDPNGCPPNGPWFVVEENFDIALIIQIDGERFGRIAELANFEEESWDIAAWRIRSSNPVDAWLHVTDPVNTRDHHVFINELDDGWYLRTDVMIDMKKAKLERKYDPPRIAIADGMVEVSACEGRYRSPLPPGRYAFENKPAQ